jgi:hypothetical protein
MKRTAWLVISLGCGGSVGSTPSDGGPDGGDDMGLPACSTPVAAVCFEPLASLEPNDPVCPNPEPPAPDRLDDALAAAGLDRCTSVFTSAEWDAVPSTMTGDPFRLPHLTTLHDAPLRAPGWAHQTATALDGVDTPATPVASAIHLAADRLGQGDEVCTPTVVSTCLASAIASLRTSFGLATDAADVAPMLDAVPADLAQALAPIVQAIEEAATARDTALAGYGGQPAYLYDVAATATLYHKAGSYLDFSAEANRTLLAQDFDYAALFAAATKLAATIEGANLGRFAGSTGFAVSIPTPLGTIAIRDAADDAYEPSAPEQATVLLVDTGGDDTYHIAAGATVGVDSRVAVAIDLGGDDTYGYPEVADPHDGGRLPSDSSGRKSFSGCDDFCSVSMQERQGAARLGIGMLFDLGGGNDTYTSLRMSQGFAALGVGVLFDDGGDDTYTIEAGGQGSAQFGIGLLLDEGGADRYVAYQLAQGYGFAYGFGALRDGGGGDDEYFCDPGDPAVGGHPLYTVGHLPSAGNLSYCQGAAEGLGFAATCASCMSGGIGVLRDAGGDDLYTTSVFGQGAATWFGTGILDDEAGNDRYRGLWTVQGAAEDFSLAVFRDGGGNDTYNAAFPVRQTALGAGENFSVGLHLDLGGTDAYTAGSRSLGSAVDNSHGYCIDQGGNDSYVAPDDGILGGANDAPCLNPPSCTPIPKNVGVFVDVGGTDGYTITLPLLARGNDQTWVADPDADANHTAGLDQAGGDVVLP